MSQHHKMSIDLLNFYFYLTGNEPDTNWIDCHKDSSEEYNVEFYSHDEIPLEYDYKIRYSLNELLEETEIGPYDYEEAQKYKKQLLIDRITIIQAALCIDVVEPYDGELSFSKEAERFFRLNSLIKFIIDELLQLPQEMTNYIATLINIKKASRLLLVDESTLTPLLKLVAISSWEFCDSLDSSMFDEKNNFDISMLNDVFKKISIIYKEEKEKEPKIKEEEDISLPFKRLTYQYFIKKAEQS